MRRRPGWPTPTEVVGLGFDARNHQEFRSEALRRLLEGAGADYAMFSGVSAPPRASEVLHLDLAVAEEARHTYLEGSPLLQRAMRALSNRGAVVDTELYSRREWERLPYVQRHQRKLGVRSNLVLSWLNRGGEPVVVCLARMRRPFTPDDEREARKVRKALAVADGSFGFAQVPDDRLDVPLTTRQRDVLGYLCRGFSNAEIACACGVSTFTVRNHLVKLFERFQVATRTELAMLVSRRL